MSSQTITVPDIGGAEGVEVIEICVAVGDTVEAEQSLIVIETDKATVDVPCPAAGKITDIKLSVGDKVSEGDVIGELAGEGSAVAPEPAAEPAPAPVAEAPAAPAAAPAPVAATTSAGNTVVPEGVEDAEVIEVSIAVGDVIEEGDTVAVLETDKATVDVPATSGGKVTAVKISVGDKLSSDDVVADLEVSGGAAPAAEAAPAPAAAPAPVAEAPAAPAVSAEPVASVSTVPDGADDAEVIEVLVAVGDTISEGDDLAVLETDKATVEVPANAAGKVTAVKIAVGDKLSSGDVVVELEGSAPAAAAPAPAAAPQASAPAPAAAPAKAVQPAPEHAGVKNELFSKSTEVYAGPAVRTHARDLGVDLADVKATGPRGRILKEDVDNYVKNLVKTAKSGGTAKVTDGAGIPPMPKHDFSKFGEVETVAMSKIQKLTAMNMHRNWLHIPAVTQFDDADITDLEAFRKGLKAEAEKRGVKLTPLPFLLKACAAALKAEKKFNASLGNDGESVVYKKYVNIGIAADTPVGLLVPVIKDVDKKGLWELAEEANALIKKARDGKLSPSDMQGGCFTISSLGAMGGTGFTPIVNAPEVAILGVSKAQMKPIWNGKEFEPRNMLPLALSYDHRVINGADCGKFFTYLVSVISDVRRLLL
ncbi:dihydrolipoyllysine-residue acetyltransferase [Sessilibacter corallicola]|uniref:dihydrolipoyllysine-residue acetyltransferase n=1 Tax=Sessilibacter corallicola TaxID=2904075 RepID=UPI001E37FA21|nr:dihydrolipoyllysine-residue acetyltransferase [Sessilibacter corallicola]